jgi:hypothetical protein
VLRLSLRVPTVISGVPVPDAENPLIAAPAAQAVVAVSVRSCPAPGIEAPPLPGSAAGALPGFWSRLTGGLSESLCAELEVESLLGRPGPAGLYAALTAALLHALARSHGDVMTSEEIVEVARLADPFDYTRMPGWAGVMDALRYSAATGKVVAWRNDEEHGDIADGGVGLEFRGERRGEPRVSRDSLGGDVYSAIVHLAGVATLSAAVRIRDGEPPLEAAWVYKPVDEAMALLLWGVAPPGEGCMLSPGLPGVFEEHCRG